MAIELHGWDKDILSYVKNQTPEICLEAVEQNGEALQHVKEQTPEICLAAVRENPYALEFVKERTQAICLEAVKENGRALACIPHEEQTLPIAMAAMQNDFESIEFLAPQFRTPEFF